MLKKYLVFSFCIFTFWTFEENLVLDPVDQISQVSLHFDGLQSQGDSLWYEAWIIYDESDTKKSIGVFQIDDQGNPSPSTFQVPLGYLQMTKSLSMISMVLGLTQIIMRRVNMQNGLTSLTVRIRFTIR